VIGGATSELRPDSRRDLPERQRLTGSEHADLDVRGELRHVAREDARRLDERAAAVSQSRPSRPS
jgi:hypothetical protein